VYVQKTVVRTYVRSAIIGVDEIRCHEELLEPPSGIIPVFVDIAWAFSTALIPQLQLRRFHWLWVCTVRGGQKYRDTQLHST